MQIIHGFGKVKRYRKTAAAIGVFDGLHRAHCRILESVIRAAKKMGGKSVVITFSPHPRQELDIYPIAKRLKLLAEFGIDIAIVIALDRRFSRLTADGFVKDILVGKLGVRHLCVGKNFRFGRDKEAGVSELKNLSCIFDFALQVLPTEKIGGRRVSSSHIRHLIASGDLKEAQRLLAHPVSIFGRVSRGSGLGKKLGFPTANIIPCKQVLPPAGVYRARIIINHKEFNGICYLGSRPTLQHKTVRLEAHIFNFNKRLYGRQLEVNLLDRIRCEEKFTDLKKLSSQVKKDIRKAKKRFSLPLN